MNVENRSESQHSVSTFSVPDLSEMLRISWKSTVLSGFAFGILALALSFLVEPVYRAQAVLEFYGDPTKEFAPQGGVGALSGIASFAGLSLGSSGVQKEASIASLRSRAFARQFISKYDLMTELNRDKWDADKQAWSKEPNGWRTVEMFRDDVMHVFEDPKTGLVSVSIEWRDPEMAADWAAKVVTLINQHLKEASIDETNRSLAHLKAELDATQNKELQRVIADLTESKIEALMFADIRDEFAFRTIDPAVVPPNDEYVWPNHLVFLLLGGFAGGVLGAFSALILALARATRRAQSS